MKMAPQNLPNAPFRAWVKKSQGSALILTLLVLLVLTGLGMTAMHSVGRSLNQSGAYRVRAQASGLANAAVLYTGSQAGKHAQKYWSEMNNQQELRYADNTGSRIEQARRGPFLKLTQQPTAADAVRAFTDIDIPGETGLLAATGGAGDDEPAIGSFESDVRSDNQSQFISVIRDPMDGPPAPGAGESFCYKRVTVASQAMLGDPSVSVTAGGNLGNKRALIETYIGPIDCGAR